MRGSWLVGTIGLAGLICCWGCGVTVEGGAGNVGGTGSSASSGNAGGTGGAGGCIPGAVESCYTGPEGTLGVGICTAGLKTCNPEGTGYGDCIGEVLPQTETCGNLTDDDCNGQTSEQSAGCVCLPGSTEDCPGGTYSGPPGTDGVGACHGHVRTCNAEGTAYGDCSSEVLPQVETCNTPAESPADEDCDGQTNEGVCKFVALSAAGEYSIALRSDGTVWAFGNNHYGNLGDGTTNDSLVPIQVRNLDRIISISAGYSFSMALRSDGTLWTWGHIQPQQLPIDSIPVAVPNLSGTIAISAGWTHGLAVRAGGTVWGWGYNYNGALGNGTLTEEIEIPVQALSLTDATAVAGCEDHSLGLDSSGGVWAWGKNFLGSIGLDETVVKQPVPIPIAGVDHVTAIAGGLDSSLALRSDGTVWAWGINNWGFLGLGTTDAAPHPMPSAVPNLTSVTAIAAGRIHALALRSDGTVWTWGSNDYGQIGNGTIDPLNSQNVPVMVPGLSNVVGISGGWGYSLALQADGTAWAWGKNYYGELGIGTLDDQTTPTKVILPP